MDNKKELRERWFTYEGILMTEKIISHLHKKKKIDESLSLEKINGKWDLRGFYFPSPQKATNYSYKVFSKYKEINLTEVDFSYADLCSLCFEDSQFSDCIFRETDLRDLELINCDCIGSTFYKSTLMGFFFNRNKGKKSGSFIKCHFKKSKFKSLRFNFPVMAECIFENCLIENVEFDGSRFEKCKFIGTIGPNVSFEKHSCYAYKSFLFFFERVNPKDYTNEMLYVDFTEADLDNVYFATGLDLTNCFFNEDTPLHTVTLVSNPETYKLRTGQGDYTPE